MSSNVAFLLGRSHNRAFLSTKKGSFDGISRRLHPCPMSCSLGIARSSHNDSVQMSKILGCQMPYRMGSASTPNDQCAIVSFPGPVLATRAATASRSSDRSQLSTWFSVALLAMISGGTTFFIQSAIGNKYDTTDCDRQDEWSGTDKSGSYFLATSALTMADPSYKSSAGLESNDKEASVVTERTQTYEVSVRALKGSRITMEDEYVVNDKGSFAAVFDGHGGSGVSRYLRETLHDRVSYFLNESTDEVEVYKEDNDEVKRTKKFLNFLKRQSPRPTIEKMSAALQSAFRTIDREVMMNDRFHYQGSTAVAVVIHEPEDGPKTLLAANIGDSRAVLSRCKSAVNLTRDHKPHLSAEKARIESMGEKVEWDGYIYRVRDLSLSRAIGDRHAKPAVSGEVEITQYPVKEGDEFVVLASDGLWDVMSSQEAVDFVHLKLNCKHDYNESTLEVNQAWNRRHMSRFLANEAINRGTGDNVCVLILWLNELNEQLKFDE